MPSSSPTRGSQPRSSRIRVVSAFVRRWSPGTSGSLSTVSGFPATRSKSAIDSSIDASSAPPTLYVPLPPSIAAIVAVDDVGDVRPAPALRAVAVERERAASARAKAIRVNAMSGR